MRVEQSSNLKIQNSDRKRISIQNSDRNMTWFAKISKRNETSFCTSNTEHVPTPLFSWFGLFFSLCLHPSNVIEINNGFFHLINTTREKNTCWNCSMQKIPCRSYIPSKSFDSLNCAAGCAVCCVLQWWILLRNRSHYYPHIQTTAERLTHTSLETTGNSIRHRTAHTHTLDYN